MAAEETTLTAEEEERKTEEEGDGDGGGDDESSSLSSSSSEYDSSDSEHDSSDSEQEDGGEVAAAEGEDSTGAAEDENSPEASIRRFGQALNSRANQKMLEREERNYVFYEDNFDFPPDPERWREEDLRELWVDAPFEMTKPGWDPFWADEDDWEVVQEEIQAGNDPPIAPFYLPYRKFYPVIPDNHYDISNPKSAIEELDRIEEFLKWVSYIFEDGSSYEGTVWDDLAHGKGVYVAEQGLVRYEGEWLRNEMSGHGVVEVDIPDVEPIPGSKLEAKMRAEGRIISRDFMAPDDKHWLEMDIEDSVRLAGNLREIPFYEKDIWIDIFGSKPEKGRYKYAGQWKHGRMHGCGVYEVNEQIIYGRFYFGQHLEDSAGCDDDVSALHAGIAEVAAAKARMFVNKPDGMVREERGPYGDPQHPYFYEEDDVWMAPGFVNQFYEVPDYWKTYVEEVDQEIEMWLNSFYKAPLRIPMPAELEYWWSKADDAEFVLVNKEPEPDPEDPTKLIYTEDPIIVHTPSGRLINYVEDEEHGVRLFWQPQLEDGEDVDPEKAEFLPLGFDEFYGRSAPGAKKESRLMRLIVAFENAVNSVLDKLERWAQEKLKEREMNLKLIKQELEFIDAEIALEEAMEDLEMDLKLKQEEEEKQAASRKDEDGSSPESVQGEVDLEEGEDEEEDEGEPTSFGTVLNDESDRNKLSDFKEESKPKSPFSSLSMSLATCNLSSLVRSKLHMYRSFISWTAGKIPSTGDLSADMFSNNFVGQHERVNSVSFPRKFSGAANLIAVQKPCDLRKSRGCCSQMNSIVRILPNNGANKNSGVIRVDKGLSCHQNLSVLSFHVPITDFCTV